VRFKGGCHPPPALVWGVRPRHREHRHRRRRRRSRRSIAHRPWGLRHPSRRHLKRRGTGWDSAAAPHCLCAPSTIITFSPVCRIISLKTGMPPRLVRRAAGPPTAGPSPPPPPPRAPPLIRAGWKAGGRGPRAPGPSPPRSAPRPPPALSGVMFVAGDLISIYCANI